MVDVLLINPRSIGMSDTPNIFPSSLLYLASVLQHNNIKVDIFDLNVIEGDINSLIIEKIKNDCPLIVGIGCLFSGHFRMVRDIASLIKSHWENIIIAIGGIHPTIYAKEIIENCKCIDWVFIAESEYTFLEAVKYGLGLRENLDNIDGIAYRSYDGIVVRQKEKFIEDLDSLLFPSYNLVNVDNYKNYTGNWHNPRNLYSDLIIPIISSRSCPRKCNFCSMFLVMGEKIRCRSPKNVVDEIEMLYNQYGCRRFSFMDDNLTLKRDHIIGICNEILDRNLDIQIETPNGVATYSLDEEMLDLFYRAGLVRITIAIESGSDYIRNDIMGKHLKKEKIYEISKLLKKYPDIYSKAFFLIGMPEDTRETLEETYQMIKDIDIDEPVITNVCPFPGTRLFDQIMKDDLLVEKLTVQDLWQFDKFYYTGNQEFYIKPYNATMSVLKEYRKKFDLLISNAKEKWNNGRKYEKNITTKS